MQMILFGRSRALLTGNLEPWQLCFDVDVGARNLWGTTGAAWVGPRWPGNDSKADMGPTLYSTTTTHQLPSHHGPHGLPMMTRRWEPST